jgi:hypothetical protein
MALIETLHITAAYSNAVLVAILPHISDFANKMDLPIQQPITESQVLKFRPDWMQGSVGGGVYLKDNYQFGFDRGNVVVFNNLTNNPFITDGDPAKFRTFAGHDNMTTNDAIRFARDTIVKLGYTPQQLRADLPPYSVEPPFTMPTGERIPYCEIRWDNQDTITNNQDIISVVFQIDMERRQLVGASFVGAPFDRTNPFVNVVPETEKDYLKRVHGHMTFNTNAPKIYGQ